MEFVLCTSAIYTSSLYNLFYSHCNSTALQRRVWINMNLRCCNWAQECNDGNFSLQINFSQETLNAPFPQQNSNQTTVSMLLKWLLSLTAPSPHNWFLQYISQYKRVPRKELAVTHLCSSHQSCHWNFSQYMPGIFALWMLRNWTAVFKETNRIIRFIQQLHFCLLTLIFLQSQWRQYKTGVTLNQ